MTKIKLKQCKEETQVEKHPAHKHFYTMELEQQSEAIMKSLNYGARLLGG